MQNFSSKVKVDINKRVYIYAISLIKFIDRLDRTDLSTQIISRQLLRSGTSIGANIIEAKACSTRKDFTNFFNHSLKSANESKFWLGILRDTNKANKECINKILKETIEISNIIASSILTLKNRR